MPRPKPPEVLKSREIRLSDSQMAKFKALGGAKWLRDLIDDSIVEEKPCPPVVMNTVRPTVVTRDGTVLSVWRHIAR